MSVKSRLAKLEQSLKKNQMDSWKHPYHEQRLMDKRVESLIEFSRAKTEHEQSEALVKYDGYANEFNRRYPNNSIYKCIPPADPTRRHQTMNLKNSITKLEKQQQRSRRNTAAPHLESEVHLSLRCYDALVECGRAKTVRQRCRS
jgi:hypothetical protein